MGEDPKLQGRMVVRFLKYDLAAEHRHLMEHGEAPAPKEDLAWIAYEVWEIPREGETHQEKFNYINAMHAHIEKFVDQFHAKGSGWVMIGVEFLDWAVVQFHRIAYHHGTRLRGARKNPIILPPELKNSVWSP